MLEAFPPLIPVLIPSEVQCQLRRELYLNL